MGQIMCEVKGDAHSGAVVQLLVFRLSVTALISFTSRCMQLCSWENVRQTHCWLTVDS